MSSRSRMDMNQAARPGYSRDENIPPDGHSGNGQDSTTESAYTTSVSRLKNRFQTEDSQMAGQKHLPPGRVGYPGVASPDIKRRKEEEAAARQGSRQPRGNEPAIDPSKIDPQKFFETTNHVQRFQYTRSLFAQMEEQNSGPKKASESKTNVTNVRRGARARSPGRSTSPAGNSRSPMRAVTPPALEVERRARSSSDSTAFEQEAEKVVRREQNRQYRAASVDRLDDDRDYDPAPYNKPDYSTAISKSETDLTKNNTNLSRSDSDVVQTKVPSPKWLMKKFESEASKNTTTSGGAAPAAANYTRPNYRSYLGRARDGKNVPAANHETQRSASSDAVLSGLRKQTSQPSYRREPSPEPASRQAPAPTYVRETSRESLRSNQASETSSPESRHSSTSSYSRPGSQSDTQSPSPGYRREGSPDRNAEQYNRYRQDASPTSPHTRTTPPPNYSQHSRLQAEDARTPPKDPVQMRNQINRETSNLTAGVLLPKRRSRDENGLSKEEIEASLDAVDKYWESRHPGEQIDPRMSESQYSSGSGEEMARSDSNHELSPASPTTPTENTPGWAPRYSMQSPTKPDEIIPTKPAQAFEHGEPDYDGGYVSTTRSSPYNSPSESVTTTAAVSNSSAVNDLLSGKNTIMESSTEEPDYVAISSETHTTSSSDNVIPSLGITRHKSPAESSVSSMTPSEQDRLLSAQEEEDLLHKREEGDGHEEPGVMLPDHTGGEEDEGVEMVNQIWDQYFDYSYQHHSRLEPVGDQVEVLGDGSYWYEIEGVGEIDPQEDQEYPTAHKHTRITFNTGNIRVFSTYSVEDYDRKNEDVDPMAASAEYELEKRVEKMDLFDVQLNKGPEGLGLSIIGMGVGADAGLEKLGIFIKTLTDGGAASRDGRIQVNDQIIEVDGKSLVGVTQAYAASVLRNTSGTVNFMVGREKDPSKSEVARLIQQSIEQDRMRLEHRERQMQQRLDGMQQQQQQQHAALAEQEDLEEEEKISPPVVDSLPADYEQHRDMPPLPSSEPPLVDEEMEKMLEGAPSPLDTPVKDRDFMDDSSSEGVTPDMDPQVLFIKLKEAQYRNAVSEAELAKVRAKMILLENSESQKKLLEKKNEDISKRLLDNEKTLQATQKELSRCKDLMEDSQGQYISLENEHHAEYNAIEKKYSKAKKLIKEYQTREMDYQEEREATYQQGVEKDLHYNKIVKSLKDRIFELEKDLGEALKAAGLPPVIPRDKQEVVMAAAPIQAQPRPKEIRPVQSDEISMVSEDDIDAVSSPEYSPDREESVVTSVTSVTRSSRAYVNGHNGDVTVEDFSAVPETQLLDNSASKDKAQLGNSGALAARRKPTKPRSGSLNSQSNDEEDDPFFQHDSDGTVRKNRNYKKRPVGSESDAKPSCSASRCSGGSLYAPDSPPHRLSQGDGDFNSVFNEDDASDSSSISQTSYDPSQPMFSGREDEIPSTAETNNQDGGIMLISSKPREDVSGPPKRLFGNYKPSAPSSSSSGDGGIQLISKKTLPNDFDEGNTGSIQLVSSRPIDTGYGDSKVSASAGNNSSYTVGEYDHESKSQSYDFATSTLSVDDSSSVSSAGSGPRRTQYQTSPVQDWSPQQVCHWLLALELDQYAQEFMAKAVDGNQLLQLDNNRIKTLGINSSKDRELLKKKIKELKSAIERERKQQEKERKARERLEGQANPKKKKFFSK